MADFDLATGTFTVPWWGAVSLLALIVALAVVAVLRAGGARAITVVAQAGALAIVVFGGWAILERIDQRDRADERRAFDARVTDLAARAMAPGSALGCLDPLTADALDEACEKAIFNSPENVAAATAYVAARLSLLADAVEFDKGNPGNFDQTIADLRRPLERDRYGIVAHIFAVRDGCNVERCEAFALLADTTRIVSNLRSQEFESRIAKVNTTASTRQTQTPAAPAAAALASAPHVPGSTVTFPSASTIPPVSIMNNEPGATGQTGMEEKAEAKAEPRPAETKPAELKPAAPKRQADKPAEKPAPRRAQATQAPMPIAPARADAANPVQ
jgi:hypothetical protein